MAHQKKAIGAYPPPKPMENSVIPEKRSKIEDQPQGQHSREVPFFHRFEALDGVRLNILRKHLNMGFQFDPSQQNIYKQLQSQYGLIQDHQQLQNGQEKSRSSTLSANDNNINTPVQPEISPEAEVQNQVTAFGDSNMNSEVLDTEGGGGGRSCNRLRKPGPPLHANFRGQLRVTGHNQLRSCNENTDNMSLTDNLNQNDPPNREFQIGLTAKELLKMCKGLGLSGVTNASILQENAPPPFPPEPPKIQLEQEQLKLKAPSMLLKSKEDAFDPELHKFCLIHPIVLVQGISGVLNLDLNLFTTETLAQTHPQDPIELRVQQLQKSDENLDTNGQKVWNYYSQRSSTTIAKYAAYQDSYRPVKESMLIKFGTNLDLSDEKKWKAQLKELEKLPSFARVVSAGNMLSHVGHAILGMNTVQLYLKVQGSRTPGHQENNNFCSININIGPGDSEWFAVSNAYWGVIQSLCQKKGINYLKGSWWPNLEDCSKAGVPVYRFTQKPGDLVWVNSGCVHWVQATGKCNNIAWNVGPLTADQFQFAIERYEWNKLQRFKSIVPMIHLSWNIARNRIRIRDKKLFMLVKGVLMRTLTQYFKLMEFVKSKGITILFQGRSKNQPSHYCERCEVELFNLLFLNEKENGQVVYCIDCARKFKPDLRGFICLEEYKLHDLMSIYDSFVHLKFIEKD